MGKDFKQEISDLPKVYSKAKETDCKVIEQFLEKYQDVGFIAIGSGGSYSVAKIFESMCTLSCIMCKPVTPLELGGYRNQLQNNAAVIFTANGANTDTKNSYKYCSGYEMPGILTCCMKKEAPIKKIQRNNLHNYYFEHELSGIRDGYLSVESLVYFMTVLSKAFYRVTGNDYFGLFEDYRFPDSFHDNSILDTILSKESIIVLYGGCTTSAAFDLESKFSEVSLGNVQLVDFRNFAHGRHFWLADRANDTGIIALIPEDKRKLSDKTLSLVPDQIPVFSKCFDVNSIKGLYDSFLTVFQVVDLAGKRRGINPGKPQVPDFGRKMYHISYNLGHNIRDLIGMAAERKAMAKMTNSIDDCYGIGKQVYRNLEKQLFKGIVFDYDGTLHDKRLKTKIEEEIFDYINNLVEAGIVIGIATGRGRSVRTELQGVVRKELWSKIVIAYYNGGCVGLLGDSKQPDKTNGRIKTGFMKIIKFVRSEFPDNFNDIDGISDNNPYQLTVIKDDKKRNVSFFVAIKEFAMSIPDVKVMESSHSLDIIPFSSSKNNIFEHNLFKDISNESILRIGDAGHFLGNDYELLKSEFGLSVDSVSSDRKYCWNFSKQGFRNLEATKYYLTERLHLDKEGLHWR